MSELELSKEIDPESKLDSLSDNEDEQELQPSLLKVMVEKHEDVEVSRLRRLRRLRSFHRHTYSNGAPMNQKTVSLIKKEIASRPSGSQQVGSFKADVIADEFTGLNNFLADKQVKDIIRDVGTDTQSVIERALGRMNSSNSLEEKRNAFSIGIKELQMNLKNKKDVGRNPNYNLAMSIFGLNNRNI